MIAARFRQHRIGVVDIVTPFRASAALHGAVERPAPGRIILRNDFPSEYVQRGDVPVNDFVRHSEFKTRRPDQPLTKTVP